ncbi:MAG: 4Fe-4S binding protein [Clostridiales bacterium]|nr:4Fe-4S binding protein [Clostridiales bacterium]
MLTNLLASIQWDKFGIVIGIFAGIAVVLTICILLVAKFCKVDADQKVESILSHLAGANCGGCGCSGCSGFAEKLAKGEADLGACHVTNADSKKEICDILGVPYADDKPTVSVCKCNGGIHAHNAFEYTGAVDCAEEAKLYGGAKSCKYGCLGDGNCVRICPETAICLKDKCANVDPDHCTSCGSCLNVCPKHLFERIPADAKVYIACSSHDRGKAVMDACEFGCIACGKCAKVCPSGAITMVDNLPVIDYEKCIKCGKCAESCPRHTIQTRY